MNLDSLRERLTGFVSQTLLWIVGALLVALTTVLLLAPLSVTDRINGLSPLLRVLLVIVLDVSALAVVIYQIRQRFGGEENGLIVKTPDAITQVDSESAKERVLKAVSDLPGIVAASAAIKPVRGKAVIDLDVTVSDDTINLPQKQKEINRALKQVIHKQLGLRLAERPRIHIQFQESGALPVTSQPGLKESIPVVSPPVKPPEPEPVPEAKPEEPPARKGGLLGGLRRMPKPDVPDDDEAKEDVNIIPEPEPILPVTPPPVIVVETPEWDVSPVETLDDDDDDAEKTPSPFGRIRDAIGDVLDGDSSDEKDESDEPEAESDDQPESEADLTDDSSASDDEHDD